MTTSAQTIGPQGRYQLLDALGEGAGGRVYRARDAQSDRQVALKQLTRRRAPEDLERRFAALSQLKHENLVRLLDMYSEWEPPFYTMELVPGVSVVHYVRSGKLDSEVTQALTHEALLLGQDVRATGSSAFSGPEAGGVDRARRCLTQVCAGVQAAHAQGFVHRDLTAWNVRVTPPERVVIMDYGLATNTPEDSTGLAGTPAYMAPEQFDPQHVSPKVDWYSVGIVLFEALCGAPPFTGSAHEVFVRKRTVSPPSPSLLLPNLPDDLDDCCRGLLQGDPGRRWDGERVLQRLARG